MSRWVGGWDVLEGGDGGVGDEVPDDLAPGVVVGHGHVEFGGDATHFVQPRACIEWLGGWVGG